MNIVTTEDHKVYIKDIVYGTDQLVGSIKRPGHLTVLFFPTGQSLNAKSLRDIAAEVERLDTARSVELLQDSPVLGG